ncbi:BnaC02g44520D [Brassica napus]|uniref:BnaC02g44520D protein n=1 Tax=Brassica napus TaxID=3708 RepID=A0A078IS38_BRANA|nr:BnaC02g44520D [Brassica napus]
MMVGPVNICHGWIVLNPKREVHRRLDGRRYLRLPDATTGPDAYRNPKPTLPPRTQRILQIRREEPVKPLEKDEPNTNDSPREQDSYDGEDERDENDSPKFQVQEQPVASPSKELGKEVTDCSENEHDVEESGHVSDPGLGRATSWVASPKLKRSCSTLSKFNGADPRAFHDPRDSFETKSVRSHRSADGLMLKKHSSMQILPSGSRKLWWKLFLWSHRNLHKHLVSLKSSANNHQSGYTSDFAEQSQTSHQDSADNHQFHKNQWVAFSAESSSMKRVDEWVRGLDVDTVIPVNEEEDKPSFMASSKMVRSPSGNVNDSEAIVHANSLIQSLRKSSSMAHISSIGLKAVPSISHFTSLESIDLSNNFIGKLVDSLS